MSSDPNTYLGLGAEGNQVTESLLWELFAQAAPVTSVKLPKDRVSQTHQSFGFVEFECEEDADYAIRIMNMIKLYGRSIRVNKASADKRNLDVGANLFVGNLDSEVDEKMLYDTFSSFGNVLSANVAREPDSNASRGFGFISFDTFEASDLALQTMNHQFLCNKPLSISYAFKKDSPGERHGSPAGKFMLAYVQNGCWLPRRGRTQSACLSVYLRMEMLFSHQSSL
ncbi:Splicing factor 3B subunit 4 [Mitosporidium daphniae]|uniref:Spliceosomal protein n=1 Tax=Mitosporidium daphniae TaxID=1485682 RepID=A0A098VPL2_9MICR|nr:spliceosomal protein [Mitosporidium daphniae]KGG50958.1 spliceosomal protein [Mitosporidium daphniae]|eukprot:XP_013237385.1 spliceosomal protein [Mitosporidium daphniae]